MNPLLLKDFYKVGHVHQYPFGTTLVFSNFTARGPRDQKDKYAVFFGLKYFIKKYLIEMFNKEFFEIKKEDVCHEYEVAIFKVLGIQNKHSHIHELHNLGFLPLEIKALAEGTQVPFGVPMLTIHNTLPGFYWLTNLIESIMSNILWGACQSATTASKFRELLDFYNGETSDNPNFVDFQAHDFSFRGMFGLEAAIISGMAHLKYFKGTDTIPAIIEGQKFYPDLFGCSVPATEHSIMCAMGQENELETYRRLIEDIYPSGIVSIVSDTWDLWNVIDNILPPLKEKIMSRDGKVVIRPDSGDPVDIVTVLVKKLSALFGYTINNKGFKVLDSHIGVIYGDSINLETAQKILEALKCDGFSSENIVFGIGSFTYQYATRDTLGFAMKATYIEINNEPKEIFKNPKTDSGIKKSHKGLLMVKENENGILECHQSVTWNDVNSGANKLQTVFRNGILKGDYSL